MLRKPLGSHKETMTMTKKMTKKMTETMTKMIMISWKAVSAPVQRESLGSHKETAPALPGLSENWRGRCCLLLMRRRSRMMGMLHTSYLSFLVPTALFRPVESTPTIA